MSGPIDKPQPIDKRAPTETAADPATPIASAASPQDAGLAPGEVVGRYRVIRVIDRGGMGVVYEALDQSLDRKVALKLLLPSAARRDPQLAEKLIREARAAAGLSHPNVVSVYEVTMHGAEPVLALEYVAGVDLAGWLAAQPRTWREIVKVFAQAGEGLAAAHRAGLVHRDIKPANILVGEDRVRVADFGLARTADESVEEEVIVGTPSYMSPEQRAGRPVDAGSDQWSFCASLYEALTGAPPRRDLPPPLPSSVPAWLRKVVMRGLATDPAARHPSMDALVRELGRDRRALWRVLAVGGVIAIALAAVLGATLGRAADPCAGAENGLDGTWDAAVKARVGNAFSELEPSWAIPIWKEVRTTLKRYAADWTAMARQACEATHVAGTQSEALLDRRMDCLDRRRHALDVLVRSYATIDAAGLDSAASAARGLPPVSDCGDRAYLSAAEAPSADATDLQASEDLALARLHYVAMRDEQGIAQAKRAIAVWHANGDALREAEGMLLLGRLQIFVDTPAAIATMTSVVEAAGKLGVLSLRVEAWTYLAQAYMRAGRMQEAEDLLGLAAVAMNEISDPGRVADFHFARGSLLGRSGRYEESVRDFEIALARYGETLGENSQLLNAVHLNMSIALRRLGRFEAALEQAEKGLALSLQLGEDHPSVPQTRSDIALILGELGRYPESIAELERALASMRKIGASPVEIAITEGVLGTTLSHMGRWQEALVHFRASTPGGLPGDDVAGELQRRASLGVALAMTGEATEGERVMRAVLAERETVLGAKHADMADGRRQLAIVLTQLRRFDEADAELDAAQAIALTALGAEHPMIAAIKEARAQVAGARTTKPPEPGP